MYNSIIEFIEKDTTKIEKFIKESLLSGNMMRFEEKLRDTVLEFGRSLVGDPKRNLVISEEEVQKIVDASK